MKAGTFEAPFFFAEHQIVGKELLLGWPQASRSTIVDIQKMDNYTSEND
jgi:hypothetical protein